VAAAKDAAGKPKAINVSHKLEIDLESKNILENIDFKMK